MLRLRWFAGAPGSLRGFHLHHMLWRKERGRIGLVVGWGGGLDLGGAVFFVLCLPWGFFCSGLVEQIGCGTTSEIEARLIFS